MKSLINPPAQWLLWLGSLTCLGLGALAFWNLLQLDLRYQKPLPTVMIDSPSVSQLKVPTIREYRKMVQAPLFWEKRLAPRKPKPVRRVAKRPEPVIIPDLDPPEGRIVGIVVGPNTYALIRDEEEANRSLRKGDKWNGWTVSDINAKRVALVAGRQNHEIPLIADFAAPEVSKKVLAARQRRKHREKIRQRRKQQPGAQASENAVVESIPSLEPAQQAPALTIKEALEARQRLIASRWSGVADKSEKKE